MDDPTFQFSIPETSLELAAVERMLHVPDDSISCKIRAKRGCATHPRSIAERVSTKCSLIVVLTFIYDRYWFMKKKKKIL